MACDLHHTFLDILSTKAKLRTCRHTGKSSVRRGVGGLLLRAIYKGEWVFKIQSKKRLWVGLLLLGLLGFSFGVWVLLHPASVFVQPWRAERAESAVNGVLFGPYPVEADFSELKKRGVTTIISLLEPNVPYEKVLLERERKLASQYGMRVENFPMGSILGQKFGNNYSKNSKAAAQAALDADGTAYIHCYLGLHRAKNVQRYLAEHAQVQTQTYAGTNATSDTDLATERAAKKLFRAGEFEKSLELLATIERQTPRVLRVKGWNLYRMSKIDEARDAFGDALALAPGDFDSRVGLAYCDLAQDKPEQAERQFAALSQEKPGDASVQEGLGNAYYRQARWAEAEKAFSKLLEIAPENEEAKQALARVKGFQEPATSAATDAP